MLNDTSAKIILTDARYEQKVKDFIRDRQVAIHVAVIDDLLAADHGSLNHVTPGIGPHHLAYIMYTSGTTGNPKGVMIPHRGIIRLVKQAAYLPVEPTDTFIQLSPLQFDASTLEIWGALLNGGRLVMIEDTKTLFSYVSLLKQCFRKHSVTILWLTKTLFDNLFTLAPDLFESIRYLLVGGEALNKTSIDRLCSQKNRPTYILNGYGPTESTTFAATYVCDPDTHTGLKSIPIGKPVSNTCIDILDQHLSLCPIGVFGEICISGAGLSRGYLNLDDLTAEKFVNNPLRPGERMYRSGDIGRWLSDGNIEYLGRKDNQVKIRGHRIEMGEIESRLRSHPSIDDALVIIREKVTGDKELIAYITGDPALDTAGLSSFLGEVLPAVNLPAWYVLLEDWPLTSNGKVDRKKLPDPELAGPSQHPSFLSPRNETEEIIVGIWQSILGIERVSVNDGFFKLGGHSLNLIQVISKVHENFNVKLDIKILFENPSVEVLAKYVQAFSDGPKNGMDTREELFF